MTITWDCSGAHPQKFNGPFSDVVVAADQAAVFVDGDAALGTLRAGTHSITAETAPFLGTLSPAAELYMVQISPRSARFGSASGVPFESEAISGTLKHFGEWRYQVLSPETFVKSALSADPVAAAGKHIAALFDACALEWIAAGHMTALDLAAHHEQFRQVLPPHIETAVAGWGLRLVELGDFTANIDPASD